MQAATARCTRIANIGAGRTRAWMQSAIVPQAGQFVLARYWPGLDPYLSRAVFPAAFTSDGFALELPSEDATLPYLLPGADVRLIGPFGQPVPMRSQPDGRIMFICARSPHRLLPLVQQALQAGADVTLLLDWTRASKCATASWSHCCATTSPERKRCSSIACPKRSCAPCCSR